MRLHRKENVEIAGWSAAQAGLALIGEPDARAVLDAGRNVDRQRALLGYAALAGAFRAGILDGLAAALALRAGPLDREEALRRAHLAVAGAHGAGHRLGAGLGAGAGAFGAGDRCRHADLRGLAGDRLPRAGFPYCSAGRRRARGRRTNGAGAPPIISPKMSSKMSEKPPPPKPWPPPFMPPFSKAAWPNRS